MQTNSRFTRPRPVTFSQRLTGIYLIPHELLHVLAHRLIGSRCEYRLGDPYVRDLSPLSRPAKLFVLLFPLAITWSLAAVLLTAMFVILFYVFLPSGMAFQSYWFSLLIGIGLASLCLLYGGTATRDLIALTGYFEGKRQRIASCNESSDSAYTIR
jgi:hypothetical protein